MGTDRFTQTDEQRIIADYLAGNSLKKIADREDTYVEAVRKVLIRHGVERRPHVKRLFTPEGEDKMIAQYLDGASLSSLATEYRCTFQGVARILERRGVSRRRRGNPGYSLTPEQDAQIVTAYEEGARVADVAKRFQVNMLYVSRCLKEAGVKVRSYGDYQDGRAIVGGYVWVLVPEDSPFASMRWEPQGYVPEHRLVMAQHLGRPLRPTETVHHKDGDKANNDLGNLELRHGRHPRGVRMRCACCGSLDIEAY